jgi:cell division septum initiation protein DivIVA
MMTDDQREKAEAFLSDREKVRALVDDIAKDYLRPDYPREMLVEDVTILRGLLEAATEREAAAKAEIAALQEKLRPFLEARRAWEMDL